MVLSWRLLVDPSVVPYGRPPALASGAWAYQSTFLLCTHPLRLMPAMRCAADLAAGEEAATGEPVERAGESEPTPKPWRTATGRAAAANDSKRCD